MQNNPQPPYPPAGVQPPKSKKKLWIILGIICGVLVIVMGGCLVGAGVLGLYVYKNAESGITASRPTSISTDRTSSSPEPSTSEGGALTGIWKGTLDCTSGESLPSEFKVAESGNPIYTYQTRGGEREVELTSTGQAVRFVPPEGGVSNVEVETLSVFPEGITYALSLTGESSGGGTVVQSRTSVATAAVLSGDELQVTTTTSSNSTASQPGMVIPGDGSAAVCSGKLRKE
jgi:hypothetical protein